MSRGLLVAFGQNIYVIKIIKRNKEKEKRKQKKTICIIVRDAGYFSRSFDRVTKSAPRTLGATYKLINKKNTEGTVSIRF